MVSGAAETPSRDRKKEGAKEQQVDREEQEEQWEEEGSSSNHTVFCQKRKLPGFAVERVLWGQRA